jgi:hypothetical protein
MVALIHINTVILTRSRYASHQDQAIAKERGSTPT